MNTTTVKVLLNVLRRCGKVYMPVIMEHDVLHLPVEKQALVAVLRDNYGPYAKAPWYVVTYRDDNSVVLDVND